MRANRLIRGKHNFVTAFHQVSAPHMLVVAASWLWCKHGVILLKHLSDTFSMPEAVWNFHNSAWNKKLQFKAKRIKYSFYLVFITSFPCHQYLRINFQWVKIKTERKLIKKNSFGNIDCTMDMGAFALFTLVNVEKSGYFGNIVHISFVSTFAHMKPREA